MQAITRAAMRAVALRLTTAHKNNQPEDGALGRFLVIARQRYLIEGRATRNLLLSAAPISAAHYPSGQCDIGPARIFEKKGGER
jgi:hypothetical protein